MLVEHIADMPDSTQWSPDSQHVMMIESQLGVGSVPGWGGGTSLYTTVTLTMALYDRDGNRLRTVAEDVVIPFFTWRPQESVST